LGEGVGEGRRGLDRSKVDLADVVSVDKGYIVIDSKRWDGANESLNPNVAFAWLYVICREILETFW